MRGGAGRTRTSSASVGTRSDCVAFLQETGFGFDPLIQTAQLPAAVGPAFQDADTRVHRRREGQAGVELLQALKQQGIKSNLDLLEVGRTEAGRVHLARSDRDRQRPMSSPLVHRADISRLAYVRGKTVKHLCGGGYDTLEKIANADAARWKTKMGAYYRTLGKTSADFKAVIPLATDDRGREDCPASGRCLTRLSVTATPAGRCASCLDNRRCRSWTDTCRRPPRGWQSPSASESRDWLDPALPVGPTMKLSDILVSSNPVSRG